MSAWRVVYDMDAGFHLVVKGDYPDEPDHVILIAHSVNSLGEDNAEDLAYIVSNVLNEQAANNRRRMREINND